MPQHNITAVGRRKTSVARVILKAGSGVIVVNKQPFEKYFPQEIYRANITKPFAVTETAGKYDAAVTVEGGGAAGQAGAVRLGIARALVEASDEYRSSLRTHSLLTRDPRMVERKKYGQKKARKRFQFSKR
ncbi:MAG TPA: 30S ribosomal protein S9 [Bacteroidota bacterium]|nr:30S ribosomal protein S9 [Bacteroidota bacterium]